MNPVKVLELVHAMGGRVGRMLLVGCEPGPLDSEDMSMEISELVRAAIEEAARVVESLIADVLDQDPQTAGNMAGGTTFSAAGGQAQFSASCADAARQSNGPKNEPLPGGL